MDVSSSVSTAWAPYLANDSDLVIVARPASGSARIVHANDRLESALGYDRDELVGKSLATLHGGRVIAEDAIGGTLMAKKSGELVYGEWRSQLIADGEGPLLLLTGRIVDRRKPFAPGGISDAEKLLADTIDAIALLAHDIRGPLNTVIGYADLIAESADVSPEVAEHVAMIVRAAHRVVEMTNEIMLASRLDQDEYAPSVEPFELLALIESTVALLPGAERVALDVDLPEIHMDGDVAAVRHIVANVTSNALKYSPIDSRVYIIVTCDDRNVRIVFHDLGIGIPANEIPLVFDRFARASNARVSNVRGTGLGLYFVKQLVERSGGTIDLTSRIGSGTEVTVRLPLSLPVENGTEGARVQS